MEKRGELVVVKGRVDRGKVMVLGASIRGSRKISFCACGGKGERGCLRKMGRGGGKRMGGVR